MAESFSSLVDTFKNVGVARAYGSAVTVAGEEVIPVALVSFGFGGGSAPEDGQPGSGGSGGGGGGFVLPLGVYAKGPSGRMTFQPNTVVVLAALAPLVCAVGLAVRGIIRTAHSHG